MLPLLSLLIIPQDNDRAKLEELSKKLAQRPAISRTWSGTIPIERCNDAPAGYVADEAAWKKLWSSWRGNEPVPTVKFSESIILVAVSRDTNTITAGSILDDKGDLRFMHTQTLVLYRNPIASKYQFALIPKSEVKTINGKPIQYSASTPLK